MNRFKVWCAYSLYALLFAVVFVVILVAVTAAVVIVPTGIFLALMGGAMLLLDSEFVLTEVAPEILLYGGIFSASCAAFAGFVSVKLGFLAAWIFKKVRSYCDRVRGWCA